MEIDNLIVVITRMSPAIALIFGIVMYSVTKYCEKHDSMLIKKVIKSI